MLPSSGVGVIRHGEDKKPLRKEATSQRGPISIRSLLGQSYSWFPQLARAPEGNQGCLLRARLPNMGHSWADSLTLRVGAGPLVRGLLVQLRFSV